MIRGEALSEFYNKNASIVYQEVGGMEYFNKILILLGNTVRWRMIGSKNNLSEEGEARDGLSLLLI